MTEVTLSGGPLDGKTAEVETGQVEVVKDGCIYRHRECDGMYAFYVAVEGEKPSKPLRRGRAKLEDADD